jgi:heat-inducible transcriptional repressor
LAAIIERHLATAEPVSSSQLCTHYALDCSSATVRSVMARLEDVGYLGHPYTSAGKVPTVRAYRYFVEQLLQAEGRVPAVSDELRNEFMQRVQEVDQLIKLTAGVLAAVSQLLAVTWVTPSQEERLGRVELVRLAAGKILLIAFTVSGQEIHHLVETETDVNREILVRVVELVNQHGRGLNAGQLAELAQAEWPGTSRPLSELLRCALRVLGESLYMPVREGVAFEGAGNLIAQPEFNDLERVRRLVSTLDRREELLKYFNAPGIERDGLRVAIEDANPQTGLPSLAVITFRLVLHRRGEAQVGILGPARMPYGRMIPLVRSTAAAMNQALAQAPAQNPGRRGDGNVVR